MELAIDLELTCLAGREADRLRLAGVDHPVDVEGVDAEAVWLVGEVLDADVDLVALGDGDRADREAGDAVGRRDGDAVILGLVVAAATGEA